MGKFKRTFNFLGISKSELAAIGDSYNDISMVENSAIGFAVSNANDKLKNVADIVVPANEDRGILEAVDYVLRINKDA